MADLFESAARNNKKQAFYEKDDHKYFRPMPFRELFRKAEQLADVLIRKGVQPGDRIGVFADNRIEWMITDIAITLAGAVSVPRGADSTADELRYIANHSEIRIVFAEHLRLIKKLKSIIPDTQIKEILVLDPEYKGSESRISDLVGQDEPPSAEQLARRAALKPEALYTIIYTSGTTGRPKGVMLSHRNLIYQVEVMPQMLGFGPDDRVLSILPVWHIFERSLEYSIIHSGASMYYSSSKDLRDDFIRVKPTFMGSAPRMWEAIYERLIERVEKAEAFSRVMFHTGTEIKTRLLRSRNYLNNAVVRTSPESWLDRIRNTAESLASVATLQIADQYFDSVFLSRVRNILGGELRGTISGGGALPSHIDEFFNSVGIPVYEGYGMTECSPLISMRRQGKVVLGSVGFVPPGTQVKIIKEDGSPARTGETGVVYAKGPGVMMGYYLDPEKTSEVLQDGWMNTGDIGFLSDIGTLTLRGRAKDTIVLLGGENVEPIPIEMKLTGHKLIEQAVVTGQDKKFLTVLIWPDYDQLEDAGFDVDEFDLNEDLNQFPELVNLFRRIISELISEENGFKPFERIGGFRFLPDRLRVGDELTNLIKIKRNRVAEKYAGLIDSMYR